VIALGTNVHIFAPPSRRKQLAWCFEIALGCGPVRTVQHPAIAESMLLVDFPGGGHLGIGPPVLRDGTRRTGIHDRTDVLNTYCTSALGESCRNTADRGNQLRARVV
jgi:hypothetical protein